VFGGAVGDGDGGVVVFLLGFERGAVMGADRRPGCIGRGFGCGDAGGEVRGQ